MAAMLGQLVAVRSALFEEVLIYLETLAKRMAALPDYYPEHLRAEGMGKMAFGGIRQVMQVVEDRSAFERWLAEERERMRVTGSDFDRISYAPRRSRPEADLDERNLFRRERSAPPQPIRWDERAGQKFSRAVILGDPGFGKTWLLRYEARHIALESAQQVRGRTTRLDDMVLPIFARLSDLNQTDDQIEEALVLHATITLTGALTEIYMNRQPSEAFRDLLRKKLRSDRCVVLLDAWDEVPLEVPEQGEPIKYLSHHRQRLGQRLERFAELFPHARLLLTSRIVGYSQVSFPAQELELLAFDTTEIESFVRVWFGSDTDTASEFLARLSENHQVRGLARIPLLLSLLCHVYSDCKEKGRNFPIRRVELYELSLCGLLRDWRKGKGLQISDSYLKAKLELFKAVSYELFEEGFEQFKESLIEEKVSALLDGLKPSHRFHGLKAHSLVDELKLDGILITSGEQPDTPLLFLHRTFQEYLTASALAERAHNQGWTSISSLIDKKAWLLAWQEVIILLAGCLSDPVPFLELLTDSSRDDYFRHRLCLAARCLPELLPAKTTIISRINNGRAPAREDREVESLIKRITEQVVDYWWKQRDRGLELWHLDHCLPSLARSSHGSALSICLDRLCNENAQTRIRAVHLLGEMGEAALTSEITSRIMNMPADEKDENVISELAVTLAEMKVGKNHPEIISTLKDWLAESDETTSRVVGIFSAMNAAAIDRSGLPNYLDTTFVRYKDDRGAKLIRELVQMTGSDKDLKTRTVAALTIVQMMEGKNYAEVLLPPLLEWLESLNLTAQFKIVAVPIDLIRVLTGQGPMSRERLTLINALVEIDELSRRPDIFRVLIHMALHDRTMLVRKYSVYALDKLKATNDPEVHYEIFKSLQYKKVYVRANAAETLGHMMPALQVSKFAPALIRILQDVKPIVRGNAAWALGEALKHPHTNYRSEIITALTNTLNDQSLYVRANAAYALVVSGEPMYPTEVLSTIVQSRHIRNDSYGLNSLARSGIRFFREQSRWRKDKWKIQTVSELEQFSIAFSQ